MLRTYIKDIKKSKKALLKGWVHDTRGLGNVKFIILRDASGIIQCVLKKGSNGWNNFSEVTTESVIKITGKAKSSKVKSDQVTIKNLEIDIDTLEILNKAEPLPIQVYEKDKTIQTDLSKRLDYRYLDIRKKNIKTIFKIQSVIINSFREFFFNKEFIEIQPPGVIASSTEGGTDLFKVKYFEKDAYLAQSPQLYKQLTAISLEKVFSTSMVWRAEKHNTTKHLNEVMQMDIEISFADEFEVMKLLEEVVVYVIKNVLKKCKKELKILNVDLKVPKAKYMSYDECVDLLKKNGIEIKHGDDIEPEAERKLGELFKDKIVFTYGWPQSLKPFYIWPKKNGLTGGFDAVYQGIEISSGGQRIHIPEILIKEIKKRNLKPEEFKWYIDAFRFGAPMHSGWSIGLERLTMTILKLSNIREACLFPRDRDRLTP